MWEVGKQKSVKQKLFDNHPIDQCFSTGSILLLLSIGTYLFVHLSIKQTKYIELLNMIDMTRSIKNNSEI